MADPTSPALPSQPPPLPPQARTIPRRGVGLLVVVVVMFWLLPAFMSWKIGFLIGLGLIIAAGYYARREHLWLSRAQVEAGMVVELIHVPGKNRGTYKPRVRYTTPDGVIHHYTGGVSSNPPDFQVGESVPVATDPVTQEARLLTFGQRYGFAAVVASVGVAVVLLATAFTLGRMYMPRLYGKGVPLISNDARGW